MNRERAYKIFGLDKNKQYAHEAITKIYKQKSRKLHPDAVSRQLGGDLSSDENKARYTEATVKFQEFQAAYDFLMGRNNNSMPTGETGNSSERLASLIREAFECNHPGIINFLKEGLVSENRLENQIIVESVLQYIHEQNISVEKIEATLGKCASYDLGLYLLCNKVDESIISSRCRESLISTYCEATCSNYAFLCDEVAALDEEGKRIFREIALEQRKVIEMRNSYRSPGVSIERLKTLLSYSHLTTEQGKWLKLTFDMMEVLKDRYEENLYASWDKVISSKDRTIIPQVLKYLSEENISIKRIEATLGKCAPYDLGLYLICYKVDESMISPHHRESLISAYCEVIFSNYALLCEEVAALDEEGKKTFREIALAQRKYIGMSSDNLGLSSNIQELIALLSHPNLTAVQSRFCKKLLSDILKGNNNKELLCLDWYFLPYYGRLLANLPKLEKTFGRELLSQIMHYFWKNIPFPACLSIFRGIAKEVSRECKKSGKDYISSLSSALADVLGSEEKGNTHYLTLNCAYFLERISHCSLPWLSLGYIKSGDYNSVASRYKAGFLSILESVNEHSKALKVGSIGYEIGSEVFSSFQSMPTMTKTREYVDKIREYCESHQIEKILKHVFFPIQKEINRLISDKRWDYHGRHCKATHLFKAHNELREVVISHAKNAVLDNKCIDAALLEELCNSVKEKLNEFIQNKKILLAGSRSYVGTFFRRLLGAFVTALSLGAVLLSSKARNYFFKPSHTAACFANAIEELNSKRPHEKNTRHPRAG